MKKSMALLACAFLSLTSCGQVGPLYLPGGQIDHRRNGAKLDPTLPENQVKENTGEDSDNNVYSDNTSKLSPGSNNNQSNNKEISKDSIDKISNNNHKSNSSYSKKTDDDPTKPARDLNTPSSESVDIEDNFAYDGNILNYSIATSGY